MLADRAPNAVVGAVLGWAYLIAGVAAVAVTLGVEMASGQAADGADFSAGRMTAYLVFGGVLIAAALRGMAKTANSVLGGLYVTAGVVLLVIAGSDSPLLALNHPDSVIHLGSAALLLGVGRTQD